MKFVMFCRECDPALNEPMEFASPAHRGKWASSHTHRTDHDSWLVFDTEEDVLSIGLNFWKGVQRSQARDYQVARILVIQELPEIAVDSQRMVAQASFRTRVFLGHEEL